MALLEIVFHPDPVLRKKCSPVESFDAELREIAQDMIETMYDANGIGLAGPQVAYTKQILVLDISQSSSDEDEEVEPKPQVFINPKILKSASDESDYEEGCLSIPGVYAMVTRPEAIRLSYFDLKGNEQEIEASGMLATVLQHEIDHLNGVLFVDHLGALKRKEVLDKYRKLQLEKQE